MIQLYIGTKAQFIKMAPIMVELRRRGVPYRYIDSGQHAALTRQLRRVFGIGEPDVSLRKAVSDIVSTSQAVLWTLNLLASCVFRRRWLRREVFPGGTICLIHGDTLSTLLGMHMALAAGLKIAHVEAGLRSHRIFDPFPEELVRIWCMRFAHLLFVPSDEAARNVEAMKLRGKIVHVHGNTVVDALRLMENIAPTIEVPNSPFALATCHRVETITRRRRLAQVVDLLNRLSESITVLFVTHEPTRRYLDRFGIKTKLDQRIRLLPMQDYVNFSTLLKRAHVVLTDGGSIQEECSYLNKPCLILRNRTERPDGLDRNATLWRFDPAVAEDFMDRIDRLGQLPPERWPRPSAAIVDTLLGTDSSDATDRQ